MPEFTITLTDSPDPADVDVVKKGLDAYDAAYFGKLPDMPPGHIQYFLHKKLLEDSK